MRINEVASHIQNMPTPKKKHAYIVPIRVLGTCNIQSDTAPEKAHIILDNQIIGNQPSDIAFEVVGGDKIIAVCECYGNIVANAIDHEEVENLVKTFTPSLSCPIGDYTLKKSRIEIVGNIIRVDFQQQSIAIKVDRTGAIHAH
ncbi:hypothetical protein [Terasakiella pusilla]|uniref:hypothetical protein n=1 Tax=Terasakiella pusilla TaxID=64973 RepID=UPI0004920B41|nr:hypothetical protein [Terasakiella pusilla]